MKRVLCVALVLLLLLIGCSSNKPQTHEQNTRSFATRYSSAMGMMYAQTDQGKKFGCSATAFEEVNDGYLFLSAAHCVAMAPGPLFISPDTKNPEMYYPAEVVAYGDINKDQDFSVLYVKAVPGAFSTVALGDDPSTPGEPVMNISSPGGIGKVFLRGYIAELQLEHLNKFPTPSGYILDWNGDILFEAPGGGPGSSGSMIVCENQMKACGVFIGTTPAGLVAEPISKFKAWWKDVLDGKTPRVPPPPAIPDLFKLLLGGLDK